MIDLHSHILPGVDDGAPDMATAVAMAKQAYACGIRKVIATPHVDAKHNNHAAAIRASVAELNRELVRSSVALEVLPGAEIAAQRLADIDRDELDGLGLGGGPYLLIEAPLSPTAADLEVFLQMPAADRRRYVLAHPERSPTFQREPERLRNLVLEGTLVSITAGALSGRFGGTVRRFATSLLEEGMVHNVASDMHDTTRRPPGISGHLRAISGTLPGLVELERWLTLDVPAAVIAGRSVEMPPRLERRRSFSLGRMIGAHGRRAR